MKELQAEQEDRVRAASWGPSPSALRPPSARGRVAETPLTLRRKAQGPARELLLGGVPGPGALRRQEN